MSSSSHLDERSFEQLLAAAYTLQQQLRRPVLVPSNAKAANVPTASQRKTAQMAVGKTVGVPITAHGSATHARKSASSEVEEAARLAAIAETHATVHKNNLSLPEALQLIACNASSITRASGAAIWLVQSGSAVCRAASGARKDMLGRHMEIATGRLAACLDRDEVLRIWNAQTENTGIDSSNNINTEPGAVGSSLLAVPIHHEGKVEGVLEVVFPRTRHFSEADLRTCQILSGLVSEAIALAAGQEWKHVLDSERAALLQALDLIQPHLARLLSEAESTTESPREIRPVAENPSGSARSRNMARLGEYLLTQQANSTGSEYVVEEEAEEGGFEAETREATTMGQAAMDQATMDQATMDQATMDQAAMDQLDRDPESWRSRHQLLQEMPTNTVRRTPREVQTALNLSVAPALRPAAETTAHFGSTPDFTHPDLGHQDLSHADLKEVKEVEDDFDSPSSGAIRYTKLLARTAGTVDHIADANNVESPINPNTVEAAAIDDDDDNLLVYAEAVYSEAENLAKGDLKTSLLGFWTRRWADLCLAVSAGILGLSLVWAFWPASPTAGRPGSASSQGTLTPIEQLLVSMGLAEVPVTTSVYMGSPNAQVWVNMRTAVYYCSGSEEYGKPDKGKFLSQHDAQYQQFQPARGRACD